MVGRTYNNATIIVEGLNQGLTVLEKLQHDFYYENLYESTQGTSKSAKAGIKTTQSNRPKFLETLQTRLINNSIAIRSRRFVKELKGFIWDTQIKKAKATKGFHDDAIFAMCLALYARDSMSRQSPMSLNSMEEYTESFKSEIYDEIKAELAKNAPDDWMDPDELDMLANVNRANMSLAIEHGFKRQHDSLLKEFGW
jgi:hypothetical protein